MVKKYLFIGQWPTQKWIAKLFHYGKFSFGTNVSGMLFNSIDQMMLGAMTDTSQVAIYNASSKINNLIEVPISTVASIVFPQTSLKANKNDDAAIRNMYEKSVSILLAMILPILIVASVVPSLILTLIAGPSYGEFPGVLVIILFFSVLQPFSRQFGTVMDSMGKPDLNFYCISASALVNLGLNLFLIPKFGIYGAALSTLIALTLSVAFNMYVLHKLIKVNLLNIFKGIIPVYRFLFLKGMGFLRPAVAKEVVV
jgi:O-antigen/teichoic acid export membrane protein